MTLRYRAGLRYIDDGPLWREPNCVFYLSIDFLNISANEVDYNYRTGNKVCGDDNDLMEVRSDEDDEMSDDIDHVINNKPKVKKTIGAIRISFGYMSNMSDVLNFVKFLKVNFIDKSDNNNKEI